MKEYYSLVQSSDSLLNLATLLILFWVDLPSNVCIRFLIYCTNSFASSTNKETLIVIAHVVQYQWYLLCYYFQCLHVNWFLSNYMSLKNLIITITTLYTLMLLILNFISNLTSNKFWQCLKISVFICKIRRYFRTVKHFWSKNVVMSILKGHTVYFFVLIETNRTWPTFWSVTQRTNLG